MIRRKLGTIKATVASAGTPVPLAAVEGRIVTNRVIIHAKKDATTANTGQIKIGTRVGSSGVSGTASGAQPIVLEPDDSYVFEGGTDYFDLYDIMIDAASSGDGVIAYYI